MSHGERAALGFMHPGRVDVIGGGALVWQEVLDRALERSPGAEVVVSEHDILDGIALSPDLPRGRGCRVRRAATLSVFPAALAP